MADNPGPKGRKPRHRAIKEQEPDFISKAELAHHLRCHISTIDEWIANGTIPAPHSRPGDKHPIWLRRHYNAYRDGKEKRWPKEAWEV
jgi:hypothetical protein